MERDAKNRVRSHATKIKSDNAVFDREGSVHGIKKETRRKRRGEERKKGGIRYKEE